MKNPNLHRSQESQLNAAADQTRFFEELVEDTGRKRHELRKLKRILGYGDPIHRTLLYPKSLTRAECMAMREAAGEDLDLADDIVSIVSEMDFPAPVCSRVMDFESEKWCNYDKLEAAAPDLLLALGLRDIWWGWVGRSHFRDSDSGENCTEPNQIYELCERNIRPDFMLDAIVVDYFQDLRLDFVDLLPPCKPPQTEIRARLEQRLAGKIAHLYKEALKRNFPDRPDLIFEEEMTVQKLKQELMGFAHAETCVLLTNEIIQRKTAEPPARDGCKELFFRQQRELHFQGLL